jgi:single stranded DNA-binding protein
MFNQILIVMNTIIVSGRLTENADAKEVKNGSTLLTFTLADNDVYFNADGEKVSNVEFHKCIKWFVTEPRIADHLTKGRFISAKGRLSTNKWQDDDGTKHEAKFVKVDEISI